MLEGCERLVRQLRERYGRKVSLIGWSLGGIYARETAKQLPDDVRCVITLGTPFAGHPRATNAWRLYEYVSGERVDDRRNWDGIKRAPPVPTTSIYSRTDGVVAWQCSVQEPAPQTENIEVEASHVGLGVNPAVLVRDRRSSGSARGRLAAVRPQRLARPRLQRPRHRRLVPGFTPRLTRAAEPRLSEHLTVLVDPVRELGDPGFGADLGLPAERRFQLADVADVDLLIARTPIAQPQRNLARQALLEHLDQFEQRQRVARARRRR